MDENCIFCKIVAGEIPSDKVHEDDHCVAFKDLNPQAPVHILVIPKTHIASMDAAEASDKEVLGHLIFTSAGLAREMGLSGDGYRTVINTNELGGQTVFHLHVHLLGGRQFIFPPG